MELPFTRTEFFELFREFNEATFPLHLVMQALGAAVLALVWSDRQVFRKLALFALAVVWVFVGTGYHLMYFTQINQAAWAFGALFILQGVLLLLAGFRLSPSHEKRRNASLALAIPLVLYGWIIYPLFTLFQHGWPEGPYFGVVPCPTTIFTFGALLIMRPPVPRYLLIVPLIWSVIGGSAAVSLAVPQDYGLMVAGALGLSGFWLMKARPAVGKQGSD